MSLTSPTAPPTSAKGDRLGYNIFHLTPLAFAHFYSWYSLFGSSISLPIRQGSLYPDARPPSPKFGRHIATIKYRISLAPLFIAHMYKQDAVEQWREGETTVVGVKAMVESFSADLHQREQEVMIIDPFTGKPKTSTHKPFCAAEVVITNLELRAVYAIFTDPGKALVPLIQTQSPEDAHPATNFPLEKREPKGSKWIDFDDYFETDWIPLDKSPDIWMFRAGACPRFAFVRTIPSQADVASDRMEGGIERSKFGAEDTHKCLLSTQPSMSLNCLTVEDTDWYIRLE